MKLHNSNLPNHPPISPDHTQSGLKIPQKQPFIFKKNLQFKNVAKTQHVTLIQPDSNRDHF